jgi:hypothetical protein
VFPVGELLLGISGPGDEHYVTGLSHQLRSCLTLRACLLLAMNSCSLLNVINQRWLLKALILRT